MKHGKKLTRTQREILRSKNINPENWLMVKKTHNTFTLLYQHNDKKRIRKVRY